MKAYKNGVFLIVALLILGCTSLSKEQAESTAMQFVSSNVKFFARQENSTLNLPQYDISSVSSYEENGNWVVIMHVSAITGNESKKNDLVVKLGKKGNVIEFNGKRIK